MQERAVAVEVDGQEEGSAKRYRFFMPTTELTEGILKQNQRLIFEHMQEDLLPGSEAEVEPETEDDSLLGPLGLGRVRTPIAFDHERQIMGCKRVIAERLYHYLSSLAESPWALNGGDFPIAEYIPDGMATMLGLSAYRDMPPDSQQAKEIRQLLDKIADEFRDWLWKENGQFIAPWIEVHLRDNDALRLIAIEETTLPEPGPATEPEVGERYVGSLQSETTVDDLNATLAQGAES